MRIASIILAAVATLVIDVGLYFYVTANAISCIQSCPSIPDFTAQWMRTILYALGPGILLSLIATALGLLASRLKPRSAVFIVTLLAPVVVAALIALIMQFVAGSFLPVAGVGVNPTYIPLSFTWILGATLAATPLAAWPLATFVAQVASTLRARKAGATARASRVGE